MNTDLKSLLETLQFLNESGETYALEASSLNRRVQPQPKDPSAVVPTFEEQQTTKLLEKVSKVEARRKAEDLAYNANTLDELRKALVSFEGCSLSNRHQYSLCGRCSNQ
jgi:hypothetical protein